MASTTAPSLPLSSQELLSAYFHDPSIESASKLASLTNKTFSSEDVTKQDTTSLDALLASIIDHTIIYSLADRKRIDEYITFLSYTALQIDSAVHHPGTIVHDAKSEYSTAALRPANGPVILGERLSKTLHDSLWGTTSRARRTSSKDNDHGHYHQTWVLATILARAFALGAEAFRQPLWRDVEGLFVKGLFSGDEQEPEVLVSLAVVFLGAGKHIKEFMGGKKFGSGKAGLWNDGVGTGKNAMWGWQDVVRALKGQPGDTFELAKKHIGDGSAVSEDWNSERLANETFKWASFDS